MTIITSHEVHHLYNVINRHNRTLSTHDGSIHDYIRPDFWEVWNKQETVVVTLKPNHWARLKLLKIRQCCFQMTVVQSVEYRDWFIGDWSSDYQIDISPPVRIASSIRQSSNTTTLSTVYPTNPVHHFLPGYLRSDSTSA